MPQLTFIIPFSGCVESRFLEETLLSILENRVEDTQVIVVSDGSYRDPYHLSDEEVTFVSLAKEKSVTRCVNAGIEAAKSPIICVLFPGTKWENSDLSEIETAFENRSVAVTVPEIVGAERPDRVFSCGIICHPAGTVRNHKYARPVPKGACLVPHRAGAFFRTSILRQRGGLHPALGLQMAYADFCLAAELANMATVISPTVRLSVAMMQKMFVSPFEQAKQSEQLYRLWRHRGDSRLNANRHRKTVISEATRNFPSLRMLQLIAGRMAGAFSGEIDPSLTRDILPITNQVTEDFEPYQLDEEPDIITGVFPGTTNHRKAA